MRLSKDSDVGENSNSGYQEIMILDLVLEDLDVRDEGRLWDPVCPMSSHRDWSSRAVTALPNET